MSDMFLRGRISDAIGFGLAATVLSAFSMAIEERPRVNLKYGPRGFERLLVVMINPLWMEMTRMLHRGAEPLGLGRMCG
jgi:uncharacterized membrane protein